MTGIALLALVVFVVMALRRAKSRGSATEPPTAVRVLPDAGPRRPGYRFRGSGGSM